MNTKLTIETITLLEQNLDGVNQAKPLLSLRNREIELLCHLKTNPTEYEIGDKMCISPKSVENYKKRAGDKLGLKGRRAIVNFVLKNYRIFEALSKYFIESAQRAEEPPTTNHQPPTTNHQPPTTLLKKSKIEGIIPSRFEGIVRVKISFCVSTFVVLNRFVLNARTQ